MHGRERARLHVPLREVALALERLQVVGDAVGGADAEVLANLADGRRVAPGADAVLMKRRPRAAGR